MLTAKQRLFVDGYVEGLSGAKAAIRAGYSPRTARSIACENLKKPEIAMEIERRLRNRRAREGATRGAVIAALMEIVNADPSPLYGKDGEPRSPEEWPPDAWKVVKRFSKTERRSGRGKDRGVTLKWMLETNDRVRAAEVLGDLLGMFD